MARKEKYKPNPKYTDLYPDISGNGDAESFLDRITEFDITSSGPIVLAKIRTPSRSELQGFSLFPMSSADGNTYLHNQFVFLIATE